MSVFHSLQAPGRATGADGSLRVVLAFGVSSTAATLKPSQHTVPMAPTQHKAGSHHQWGEADTSSFARWAAVAGWRWFMAGLLGLAKTRRIRLEAFTTHTGWRRQTGQPDLPVGVRTMRCSRWS